MGFGMGGIENIHPENQTRNQWMVENLRPRSALFSPALQIHVQETSMSLRLLQLLTQESLPVSVVDGEEVDAVRMLALAGHVRAQIPPPLRLLAGGHHQPPATVVEVTPLGLDTVRHFSRLWAA